MMEAHLFSIDYQIRQLRKISPVTPLFNGKSQNKIEDKDTKAAYISVDLRDKIYKLTTNSPVNKLAVYISAIKILIFKYTAQEEFVVATGALNADKSDSFIFSRFCIQQFISFKDLLKITRSNLQEGYRHQSYDVDSLVETFIARGGNPAAIFDIALIQEGLCSRSSLLNNFQLVFEIDAQDTSVTITFPKDGFHADFVLRMPGHFRQILETVTANPDCKLSEIDILTPDERHELLTKWHDPEIQYLQDKCIHQLFEEQVEQNPDAVAIVFENQQLTYQQLNEQANQLAHYLLTKGVTSEVLVGICVERSLEMIVGILGILKAGGAYVPLDPSYPQERLAFVIQDAAVPVLLTQSQLVDKLPKSQTLIICLDTDWPEIASESHKNLNCSVKLHNLAYVIYTSGSTGKPKGVLVTHSNVVRLFAATNEWYQFNAQDVFTLFHSYAFDFSVWEIWGALFYGSRLVVVPYNVSRSPDAFYDLLCSEGVTVLNQTPRAFCQLIQAEESKGVNHDLKLRLIIFGGEALEFHTLKPWFDRHGDSVPKLVNMYGITETTVHVTYRPITIADLQSSASLIGCVIPDLQVYVLDQYLHPVAFGVVGEMYVAGAGVAQSYLNRPELTKEKFIPNPFSNDAKSRLYKTGDLVRYLPSGDMEYLGRIDHQVKIRGFRIETGEIESAIATHPSVKETVVIVREDKPGEKRLVAYIVVLEKLSNTELYLFLKQALPEYMVPSAFVILPALPLTSNGKIDRQSLPIPAQARPELAASFIAPRTEEEELLSNIWSEVLNVELVGIDDNFFELGGDSILGIQVLSKAKQLSLIFSLQQLFQYQTISELAQVIRRENRYLSTPKREPFSLISQKQRLYLSEDIEDAYPLTKLQAGMVFHTEYNVDTAVYHDIFSYHLRSPLDLNTLQLAIADLISRHPILRTSFAIAEFQQPLQLVHRQVQITLPLDDLTHITTDEQEAAIETWIEQEKKRHFDWSIPPLVGFHIHRRTSETFNFTLSFHHAILDGWSVASLITELFQHYLLLLGLKVPPIKPAPSLTFRDFVALERETIESPECQKYWKQKLEEITITKLPRWTECYLSSKTGQIVQQEVTISPEISSGLKQLAKKAGVPLKSVLLAAHLRVLSLLTNQTDILTGLVSNGRPEEEDGERILGLFLNTLPFRLQLSEGTWIDLVQQTFETEQESLPFRRYPLAELQRTLNAGQLLFETLFYFTNFHIYQSLSEIPEIEALGGKFFEQTNFTFIVNFSLHPLSSQVELTLKYDANQLGEEQIKMIGGYYQEALTAMDNQPSERYEKHCLLSEVEQHQLLVKWNETKADYAQEKCLHQLFEEQVERSPDAVAVVFVDVHSPTSKRVNQQLTYRQLNEQANQLAHYLQTKGVKPEVLVGICIERSLEMVVGLLGILKAGGAYVPLEPSFPRERLSYMLKDAAVSVLLTQESLVESLPEHSAQVVCLDADWLIAENKENPLSQVKAENLAYVIYTSGSTGKPKGVQINHLSVVNFLASMSLSPGLTNLDTFNAVTTISFDIAALELYLPLIVGAKLVVVPREIATDGNRLLTQLLESESTVMQGTPATWQMLLASGWSLEKQVVKILCGGEALPTKLAHQLLKTGTQVWNLYGPTEATIWSTIHQVEPVESEQKLTESKNFLVPIGQAIANTKIYILDHHLQLVPIGVAGELHIGGVALARGYLNQPELTAQKFIDNPFEHSQKLYKTGDLARYLPDGNIEYFGRIDHQIKLRGFRIEIGEIESVLETYPQIKQAVVILREDNPGNKGLVAYLVTQNQFTNISDLRRFLQQKLPDYMIPSAFVILSTLPLTPNGKVDRKMLPVPEAELTREQEFVPPQTSIEQILATIWQDVLGIKQVSRYDKFFEIGGDSILSIQVVGRARQAGIKITPRQIFQYPTLAELAVIADTSTLMLAQQGLVTGVVPLTPIQHWFFEQNRYQAHHFNQSVMLQVPSHLQPELLSQAISKLLEHHDALRLRFVFEEGEWQQINYGIPDVVPFKVIDLSQTPQSQHSLALEKIATNQQASLHLSEGPLMKVVLFQLGNNHDNRLLIIIHHLAVDGVSWRILLEDLFTAYHQLEQQETIQLPPKTLAFKDWATLLQEYGQAQAVRSQLDYWLKQPWFEVNSLPVDYPTVKQNNSVASAANVSVNLSKEQTRALLQKVPSAYNTQINDVLLTALVQTLAQWTGNSTVLIDLEGHGREDLFTDADVSRTVGWFTSIFPAILQLKNQNHPGEALKSIKEQLRAIPQRGIGYGILHYLSQEEEIRSQLAALPLRQISFNYLGQFDQGESLGVDLKLAAESKGSNQSLEGHRTHLLDITARVIEGQLQVNWSYGRHVHQHSTVESLAQKYLQALLKLIDHCLSPEVGGYTPSDFPVANLNQQELDEILAEID
ncbi:MAG: amino acid adenylation domain-containing protein [Nostoc sp.]